MQEIHGEQIKASSGLQAFIPKNNKRYTKPEATRSMKCVPVPSNATNSQVEDPNGDVILIGSDAPSRHDKSCDVKSLCRRKTCRNKRSIVKCKLVALISRKDLQTYMYVRELQTLRESVNSAPGTC